MRRFRWQCTCGGRSWRWGPLEKVHTNARAHGRRCPLHVVTVLEVPARTEAPPRAQRPIPPERPNPEAWVYG